MGDALSRAGGQRIDLVTDSAEVFYSGLTHRRMAGFRVYPPFDQSAPIATEAPVVRPAEASDRDWIAQILVRRWGATVIVSRGRQHDASALLAVVAEIHGERLGLATYRIEDGETQLVTLDALVAGRGVGTALLASVAAAAAAGGCRRIWLVTTNDNLDAVRFYQRSGLRLFAVHQGAVDEARRLKPQVPQVGAFGIPVHDEIELELDLSAGMRPII